jgi:hypothetical protein
MRGAISKGGGNASLAGEWRVWRTLCGHETGNGGHSQGEASKFKLCRKTTGRQGVRREVESEGHAEKYRAVIEGATPLMNRSAKGGARSSLHYGGEGVLIHPPHRGVCGWHGTEDRCVTPGGLMRFASGVAISDPISREVKWEVKPRE